MGKTGWYRHAHHRRRNKRPQLEVQCQVRSPITEQKAPPGDKDSYAIVCGPPIMIKFTQPVLEKLGYDYHHIILSLENRMKCGIGICGHCNIGRELVCKDGPVFTLAQINQTPREYWYDDKRNDMTLKMGAVIMANGGEAYTPLSQTTHLLFCLTAVRSIFDIFT